MCDHRGLRGLALSLVLCVLYVLGGGAAACAETARLADIFSEGTVLQRQMPVPVWGWADAGAKVEVSFGGQTAEAIADAKGYWKAVLKPMEASTEPRELVVKSGGETVAVKNVLVGEVWLVAGQSNMVAGGPDLDSGVYPHYVPRTGMPEIRMRAYGWGSSLEPLPDTDPADRGKDMWMVMPETVPAGKDFALPQYFARVLRDGVGVPVAIIRVAVPGTNQAAWMSRETLESFPGKSANYYTEFLASSEAALSSGKGRSASSPYKSFAEFKAAEDAWRADTKAPWPGKGLVFFNFPTALYNTRIAPLAPYAFRGVIWHQGEGGPSGPYGKRLAAMFHQWRALFGHDFPVLWGTLSKNSGGQPPLEPRTDSFYRSITNVQIRKALEFFPGDKLADFVEFYDLGNENTHFTMKAEAGRRMALGALTRVYGQNFVYNCPRLKESRIEGSKIVVRLENVGKGIRYEPSLNGISGIIITDAAGKAYWADVKVADGSTIECTNAAVSEPKSVSYACNVNPHETLFNSEGLPASPFVTIEGEGGPAPSPSTKAGKDEPSAVIVKIVANPAEAELHLAHVRRDGYVFEFRKAKVTGKVTVQAYVPAEWSGFEVQVDGKPVAAEETSDATGKYVRFDVPVNTARAVVARPGKAAEFGKVNRY